MLGADRLQHPGVGGEAGLAAPLAREAELLEEDLPELLGRGDQELLVREREDFPFELRDLLAHAPRDLQQAGHVEAHPRELHRAQHHHERQLDVAHQPLQAALGDLLALPRSERAEQQRVAGGGVLHVADQAPLLAELREGVAAPCGLQQVGPQQRVVHESRRHQPERLGVVHDHRPLPACRRHLFGPLAVAGEHLGDRAVTAPAPTARLGAGVLGVLGAHVRRTDDGEAPAAVFGEQRTLGDLGLAHRHAQLPRHRAVRATREPPHLPQPPRTNAPRERDLARRGWDRLLALAERLFDAAQGIAQLVLAEDLAQARAVGLARGLRGGVEVERDLALDGRQALGDARVLGVLFEVLFALRAFDVGDAGEHVLQGAVALDELRGGLVPDPGDPGDVVGGVALEAVEVGDQRGGNAVAVEDRLVVVELGVGNPARGRHHLHETPLVDQLEDVAVARDDRHGHRGIGPHGALGERGDHVVGLVPLDLHVAVAEGLHERFHRGPLLFEQIRPGASLRLVLGEQLGTPRGAGIPRHDGGTDAVVGDDLHEHRGEPEDRVGGHPRGGGDRLGEREEGAVDEAWAVDQEEAPPRHPPRALALLAARRRGECRAGRHDGAL